MRSTFKVLFFLKRDKKKANGMIPLYCRITVDGNIAQFGMKCDVNPKNWDVKSGKAAGRTTEANNINALVDNTRSSIFEIYRDLQVRDNYVTAEKIKNAFLGIETKQQTLFELFDEHNRERSEMVGINVSKSTCHKYYNTRKLVADFILYKYNLTDIPVKEINLQFINDFDAYLKTVCKYSKNTLSSILARLKHIMIIAFNKQWISRNPFKEYKMTWQKVDKGYLTQFEIEKLIDFNFGEEHLSKARDIFIFCAFTGLSFVDVKYLTNSHIQSSVEGNLWIRGKRQKTGNDFNIPVLNIPKMIIEKYRGNTKDNLVLPVPLSNSHYNRLLKKVAKMCGISKKISSHTARHSFATLTLTKGVSIESVSRMLGHSNINTTQTYARITDKKVSSEMSSFAGNVKMLDLKMQINSDQKEITLEDILKSNKISTGKASELIWENLSSKVWINLSILEKQYFLLNFKDLENKPKTIRDFYLYLIDFFLDNCNKNNSILNENELNSDEIKFAI